VTNSCNSAKSVGVCVLFILAAVEAMLAVGCEIQAMFVVAKRQLSEWKLLVDKLEGNGTNDYDPKDPKTLPKPFRRVFCPLVKDAGILENELTPISPETNISKFGR